MARIYTDSDTNKVPDLLDREITISGIANISSGLLHEHYLQAFMQNDSVGASIFGENISEPFHPGDSLVVTGRVRQYNGMMELHAGTYRVFDGSSKLPKPVPLSEVIDRPADYIGMLVKGSGRIIEKGRIYNGKYLKITPSDTSRSSLIVYVSNFHHLYQGFDFDVLSIGDKISVTGIIGEYNPDFPEERTFKLFLRRPKDLAYVSMPRYYSYLVVGGLVLISLFVMGWVIGLRRQVGKKTEEIQTSLEEKEILLREIHHRVKNNLSIISGLMGLQLDNTGDEEAKRVLEDSQSRIHSMALIHEKLYQTESLAGIRFDNYLRELVEAIHLTFTEYHNSVRLQFELQEITLDIDRVIPCGLLVNELVVNAFKHAFGKHKEGLLQVMLSRKNGDIEMVITDNGPGLPEDFDLDNGDSLGSMLISTFAAQVGANTEISDLPESGARFKFTFPDS